MSKGLPLVLIDVTFLQDQYYRRGIGRYGREIVGRLLLDKDIRGVVDLHLVGFGELKKNIELLEIDSKGSEVFKNISWHSLGRPKLSSPLSNLYLYFFKVRPLVARLKPSLYFAAHYDRGLPSRFTDTVVFVPDYTMFALNAFSSRGKLINFLRRLFYTFMFRGVRSAKRIITCSEYSKKDLVEKAKLSEDMVDVIYLGISEIFRNKEKYIAIQEQVLTRYLLTDSDYIIYDGGFEPNKNTKQLTDVFATILKEKKDIKLVVTDKEFVYDTTSHTSTPQSKRAVDFMEYAKNTGVWGFVVAVGKVSEEELAALTSKAKIYLNLSLYEGFGFGPLQAMSVGTPVIVSDRTSFPEVAGGGASIVSLSDNDTIAREALRILNETEYKEALINRGLERASHFNWQLCYTQTKKIFTHILNTDI